MLCSLAANLGAVNYLDYYSRDVTPDVLSTEFGISLPGFLQMIGPEFGSIESTLKPANKQFVLLDTMRNGDSTRRGRTHTRSITIDVSLHRRFSCGRLGEFEACDSLRSAEHHQRLCTKSTEPTQQKRRFSFLPSAQVNWVVVVMDEQSMRAEYMECGRKVADHIMSKGWDLHLLDTLPFGFALPIREMLHALKMDPPEGTMSCLYL